MPQKIWRLLQFIQLREKLLYMDLNQVENLSKNITTSELFGCDCSLANVFLYQEKYKISSYIKDSVLFRFYQTTPNHTGWAFPVPLKTAGEDFLKAAIAEIIKSGSRQFCYCSQNQVRLIDECLAAHFPGYKIEWQTFRGDSDYLYLQKNLAELPGKNYQKKRNHISRFNRIYQNQWAFKTFPEADIKNDILAVEAKWFAENDGANDADLQAEYGIIKNAVENAEALNITGAVLYVCGEPAAMTLASPVSPSVLDVLFEKACAPAAENGAYAVINHLFAEHSANYTYLNREEDLGIEGLRKAKLSWKPEIILDKYHGKLVKI